MSSDRFNQPNRPLKPTLASNRSARTPIAPRVATVNATVATKSVASQPSPTVRSEPPGPRVRQPATPVKDAFANGNITPRSTTRSSRPGSANASPAISARPKSVAIAQAGDKSGSMGSGGKDRPKSLITDNARTLSPLVRSPALSDLSPPPEQARFEGRFFHASEAPTQEPAARKPEAPKKAQFFHADGMEEAGAPLPPVSSPVLSAVSEQRSAGPWVRAENAPAPVKSPPILSPALSALSGNSPFFPAMGGTPPGQKRSPSPSRENIHLSYRKGASQIIGNRPMPTTRSTTSSADNVTLAGIQERRGSIEPAPSSVGRHHQSPSLSSIGSSNSIPLRRKSGTIGETDPLPSPLTQEVKIPPVSRSPNPLTDLPSIDTSLESPGVLSRTESGLSPNKNASELAADARRERKVLDLEISNSSLLAINASLEREIRRQKAELKSFRRLSRAGRFSYPPGDRKRSVSDDLSALAEEDEDGDDDGIFGLPSGSVDQDDLSDDEESIVSSGEPLSDRLARDEKRLQVDLEKHRELLMQSQAMNQSLKRCMYATEDMILEGKKALEYHVRVSDVKLGGRVLSTHDDDGEGNADHHREIEVEDEVVDNDKVDQAKAFLDTWAHVGERSVEGSSEGGDRDSGIEVDRPPGLSPLPLKTPFSSASSDSSRPPGLRDLERFGSFG